MDSHVNETSDVLTSTMGSVLSSEISETNENEAPAAAVDSVPSSSSDANQVDLDTGKKSPEDPISSTSDVGDKVDFARIHKPISMMDDNKRIVIKSDLDNEADMFAKECNLSTTTTEKITENVEDLVSDLENLLGESASDYPITINRKQQECMDLEDDIFSQLAINKTDNNSISNKTAVVMDKEDSGIKCSVHSDNSNENNDGLVLNTEKLSDATKADVTATVLASKEVQINCKMTESKNPSDIETPSNSADCIEVIENEDEGSDLIEENKSEIEERAQISTENIVTSDGKEKCVDSQELKTTEQDAETSSEMEAEISVPDKAAIIAEPSETVAEISLEPSTADQTVSSIDNIEESAKPEDKSENTEQTIVEVAETIEEVKDSENSEVEISKTEIMPSEKIEEAMEPDDIQEANVADSVSEPIEETMECENATEISEETNSGEIEEREVSEVAQNINFEDCEKIEAKSETVVESVEVCPSNVELEDSVKSTSECANIEEIAETANSKEIPESTGSLNIEERTEAAKPTNVDPKSFGEPSVSEKNLEEISDSANVTETSDSANVEEMSDSANVEEISDSANVEENSEYTNVEEISKSATVEEISETVNEEIFESTVVEDIFETANVEEISEIVDEEEISESVIAEDILETANVEEISETVNEEEISESAIAEDISETENVKEISETVNEEEMYESVIAEDISETANVEEISETVNEEEISESAIAEDISEAANVEEISGTVNEEEISESAIAEDISETANVEEISEIVNEEEISDSAIDEEISETVNEEEISETVNEEVISETVNKAEISETAEEISESHLAEEIVESADIEKMEESSISEEIVVGVDETSHSANIEEIAQVSIDEETSELTIKDPIEEIVDSTKDEEVTENTNIEKPANVKETTEPSVEEISENVEEIVESSKIIVEESSKIIVEESSNIAEIEETSKIESPAKDSENAESSNIEETESSNQEEEISMCPEEIVESSIIDRPEPDVEEVAEEEIAKSDVEIKEATVAVETNYEEPEPSTENDNEVPRAEIIEETSLDENAESCGIVEEFEDARETHDTSCDEFVDAEEVHEDVNLQNAEKTGYIVEEMDDDDKIVSVEVEEMDITEVEEIEKKVQVETSEVEELQAEAFEVKDAEVKDAEVKDGEVSEVEYAEVTKVKEAEPTEAKDAETTEEITEVTKVEELQAEAFDVKDAEVKDAEATKVKEVELTEAKDKIEEITEINKVEELQTSDVIEETQTPKELQVEVTEVKNADVIAETEVSKVKELNADAIEENEEVAKPMRVEKLQVGTVEDAKTPEVSKIEENDFDAVEENEKTEESKVIEEKSETIKLDDAKTKEAAEIELKKDAEMTKATESKKVKIEDAEMTEETTELTKVETQNSEMTKAPIVSNKLETQDAELTKELTDELKKTETAEMASEVEKEIEPTKVMLAESSEVKEVVEEIEIKTQADSTDENETETTEELGNKKIDEINISEESSKKVIVEPTELEEAEPIKEVKAAKIVTDTEEIQIEKPSSSAAQEVKLNAVEETIKIPVEEIKEKMSEAVKPTMEVVEEESTKEIEVKTIEEVSSKEESKIISEETKIEALTLLQKEADSTDERTKSQIEEIKVDTKKLEDEISSSEEPIESNETKSFADKIIETPDVPLDKPETSEVPVPVVSSKETSRVTRNKSKTNKMPDLNVCTEDIDDTAEDATFSLVEDEDADEIKPVESLPIVAETKTNHEVKKSTRLSNRIKETKANLEEATAEITKSSPLKETEAVQKVTPARRGGRRRGGAAAVHVAERKEVEIVPVETTVVNVLPATRSRGGKRRSLNRSAEDANCTISDEVGKKKRLKQSDEIVEDAVTTTEVAEESPSSSQKRKRRKPVELPPMERISTRKRTKMQEENLEGTETTINDEDELVKAALNASNQSDKSMEEAPTECDNSALIEAEEEARQMKFDEDAALIQAAEESQKRESEEKAKKQAAVEAEANIKRMERRAALEVQKKEAEARKKEAEALRLAAAEAKKKEAEAAKLAAIEVRRKEIEAKKKEAEALKLAAAEIRRKEIEAKKKEVEALKLAAAEAAEVKKKEAEAKKKEADNKRREAEALKLAAAEAKKKEAEAKKKEAEALKLAAIEAKKKEAEAKKREIEAKKKEVEAMKLAAIEAKKKVVENAKEAEMKKRQLEKQSEDIKKPLNIVVDNIQNPDVFEVSVVKEAESTTSDHEIPKTSDTDDQPEYSSKMSQNQELKLTITKNKAEESTSILKIYDPKNPNVMEVSPSESETESEETPIPKLIIKQSQCSPKGLSPLKITIINKEQEQKSSPKLIIKPIVKPDEDTKIEEKHHSPKLKIKPVIKPMDEIERSNSPKVTIKPIPKPIEASTSPKIKFKPLVKPEEIIMEEMIVDEEAKERIVLKIKKEIMKIDEPAEKISKIKVKLTKEGKRAHIINDEDESSEAKKIKIEAAVVVENVSVENTISEIVADDSVAKLETQLPELAEVLLPEVPMLPIVKTPKKRGRPRKVPLQVREDFTVNDSPGQPDLSGDTTSEKPKESIRPKRSCRGPSVTMTLGIKPRKPRGAGRARGGRGSRGGRVDKPPKKERVSESKLKLIKEAAITARIAESLENQDVEMLSEFPTILIEDSSEDKTSETSKRDIGDIITIDSSSSKEEKSEEISVKSDVVMYEEETRMSAETSGSRAQTPAKQELSTVPDIVEESQSSVQSTATTESSKAKRGSRYEALPEPEGTIISADQLAEYYWGGGGPYMLQEQVAQFLGIKSFKRKYPGISRRMVDMQERDFIRESNLASENMCDLGLTAVNSTDILDILYTDFQNKYEEYCKHQRDRQTKDITNKQKALVAANQEKTRLDIMQQAIESAAQWNVNFNKARREERKACMDLQTFTINYPKSRAKQITKPKIGNYPIALVPGQYTDYYKTFTATELNNLPLNTMLYHPININNEEDSQSDGSGSETDSSSSDSDSSDTDSSDEDCNICGPATQKKTVV